MTSELTGKLAEIAAEFAEVAASDRLQLLLEFSQSLPVLPERYADHPELLEAVPECQSPIFLITEVNDGIVNLFFSAPAEAPTTRGFASILHEALDGQSVEDVLDVPEDTALRLSLTDQVSPLRLNGMSGMLARIQRQVREKI
ncbi:MULTISPECIES: SufE family protein [unclassified Rothia (in: high G+C Gram-positive bacteria)]|uniref:SufE family protein n=1 Tax=unclassified Rothia (in: high G+C Gram-positive bacteria) TaxID=2689056 RepID=UPI00195B4F1D|nr:MULTISPECIES: SufE family protein [unclassified Rothia (in: high G+C Gram-positive bacteria)]MBM7051572.1 SufE family protein [Rothia sp. ZJ1223]QRZ61835.1 SufE family protein [Rothia sp. ZJ932]